MEDRELVKSVESKDGDTVYTLYKEKRGYVLIFTKKSDAEYSSPMYGIPNEKTADRVIDIHEKSAVAPVVEQPEVVEQVEPPTE